MSPRLVLPLMSQEARGKIKGLGIFYRKNGQNWLKDFQTYTDSPTLAESFQRLRVRAKVAAWQALSAPDKASWNAAAAARGGTWCGYTLFMKEYTLSGTWYQDLIDACAAAPRTFGSLSDVDDSGKAAGYVPTWDAVTGKWIPAPSAAGGLVPFLDNFAGASIFADLVLYGTSGSARTITQADGRLKFAASAGQECSSYIPRVFLSVPFFPCEIETKLAAYNKGERTIAGLYVGPEGRGTGASANNRFIDQAFSTGDSLNGVRVEGNSAQQALAANSAIPKWMKIRVMGTHQYAKWFFYYSTDGAAWTLLYTHELANALGGLACGLFIGNWYNQPAVSAEFEYFKITPYVFSGPG
ncbi:MAG: hypothetical protein NTW38_10830 [Candidatus Aminicenantes bacterium]|nr:hypothetical protein [Candidatus Aminicenantes bacterium]